MNTTPSVEYKKRSHIKYRKTIRLSTCFVAQVDANTLIKNIYTAVPLTMLKRALFFHRYTITTTAIAPNSMKP